MNINLNQVNLDCDDQDILTDCWKTIKDHENLINKFTFRMEVLGAQVPDIIAERLFCIFASVVSGQSMRIFQLLQNEQLQTVGNSGQTSQGQPDKMDFIDFVTCFIVFKKQMPDHIAQLCFEMMKLTKEQEDIMRDDIVHWNVRILQLNDNFVNLFYKRSELDPRVNITKQDFVQQFEKVKEIQFIKAIVEIVDEFKSTCLNAKRSLGGGNSIDKRRLTTIHIDAVTRQSKQFGITYDQIEIIREFFLDEIMGQSSDSVLRIYSKIFQNIKQNDVKNLFLTKITKYKANNFQFFTKLVGFSISKTTFEQKLELLFDLCNNFEQEMEQENCIIFCKMFKGSMPSEFPVDLVDFVDHFKDQQLEKVESFVAIRSMVVGLIGLKGTGKLQEQHSAIKAVLNLQDQDDFDIEQYLQQNLSKEPQCYAVNQKFWSSWIQPNQSQVLDEIDNQSLIMPQHQVRWKDDLLWNIDYVFLPKHVFRPLSKWYPCNKVIELEATVSLKSDGKPLNFFDSEISDLKSSQIGEKLGDDHSDQGGEYIQHHLKKEVNDNQFKKTNLASMNVASFECPSEEGIYNISLYPRFFYFIKIGLDGEMKHQECVVDGQINQVYMKQHVREDKIPFEEILISKHTKMENILASITAHYNNGVSTKRARLIINKHIITGLKMQSTVADLKLETGTLIYVEFLNFNNTWPTEQAQSTENFDVLRQTEDYKKTIGLFNMGNTCYMNSALQCIANIQHFYDYYIKLKYYSIQVNTNNVLGHKGQLVEAFAGLISQMWSSKQIIVPKYFKHVMQKINPQFGGDEQQDTQEYINFLIDGLHEETNMRNEKPYIEAPSSEGKDMVELGLETWSNQLMRDWSFVYFLFYGQWQSTLECLTCKYKSTKFEVLNSIALSLPEPSKILLNIVVHRLPSVIKNIFTLNQETQQFELQQAQDDKTLKENYTKLTNDQPIHICLKVNKSIRISELIKRIVAVSEVNIDEKSFVEQGFTDLILFNKNLGKVRGVFDPTNKLTQYKLVTDEIHCQEILTPRGKDYMMQMWQHNREWLMKISLNLSYFVRDYQLWGKYYVEERAKRKSEPFSMHYVFNNHYAACEKYEQILQHQKMPAHVIVVAYHRRFVPQENKIFSQMQPQFISTPLLLQTPVFPTGRRLYEEVWAMAQVMLKSDSKFLKVNEQKKQVLWWTQAKWKENLEQSQTNGTLSPFVLKFVDRQGYSCSKCNWTQKCSGCVIEPSDEERIPEFFKYCHLAIEWDSNMIEENYNPAVNEYLKHISTEREQIDDEQEILTLDSCLKKYHSIEKLQDEVNCDKCKIPRVHFKSLNAFRLPAILVIQLKRFKRTGTVYRKQSNTVEFPINNLDFSPYIEDKKFLKSQGMSTKYNLFGIINHYGSLTFGHYMSVVKNPFNDKWYKYDDQHRYEVLESQITKENAYILFYQRSDVANKTVSELFPDSQVIFPGKPVLTKFGKGFVLGAKDQTMQNSGDKVWYIKIAKDVFEVAQKDILKFPHDKFIEMCENERGNLQPTNDENQSQQSFFRSLFNLLRGGEKPKIKDFETEKSKLINKDIELSELIQPKQNEKGLEAAGNHNYSTNKSMMPLMINTQENDQSQLSNMHARQNSEEPLIINKKQSQETRLLSSNNSNSFQGAASFGTETAVVNDQNNRGGFNIQNKKQRDDLASSGKIMTPHLGNQSLNNTQPIAGSKEDQPPQDYKSPDKTSQSTKGDIDQRYQNNNKTKLMSGEQRNVTLHQQSKDTKDLTTLDIGRNSHVSFNADVTLPPSIASKKKEWITEEVKEAEQHEQMAGDLQDQQRFKQRSQLSFGAEIQESVDEDQEGQLIQAKKKKKKKKKMSNMPLQESEIAQQLTDMNTLNKEVETHINSTQAKEDKHCHDHK